MSLFCFGWLTSKKGQKELLNMYPHKNDAYLFIYFKKVAALEIQGFGLLFI